MGVAAGPWHIDDLLTFTVVTHKVDTGVLTDADSVPSYRVYEDETGTAILNGSMAKLDDANTTGFYSEQLTLSAANGFENGKSYAIYVSATVNSVVGGQTFNFKVDVPDVNVTLFGGTAGTFASGRPEVNTSHAAGTAWASGAITAAVFAADAITAAKVASDVGTEIGTAVWATATRVLTANTNLNDPTAAAIADAVWDEAQADHVAAGSFGITASEIADILVDTAEIGAAGAGLTAVPWNVAWDAEVQSEVTDALNAYDPPTAAELVSEINAVQADIAALTIPTAAAVADAVWEEAIADHSGTVGSTAEQLAAAGSAGDPWATALPGAYAAGQAGKIVGDNLNATVGSRATQTSVDDLPTNAELATALGTADDAVLAQVALVKAKTDLIPASPAATGDIPTADITAIKAKTDSLTFTVAGQVDANLQYVNDVQVTGNGQTGTEWGP